MLVPPNVAWASGAEPAGLAGALAPAVVFGSTLGSGRRAQAASAKSANKMATNADPGNGDRSLLMLVSLREGGKQGRYGADAWGVTALGSTRFHSGRNATGAPYG